MRKFFKSSYFIVSVITVLIFLGLFIVKGIYPFGKFSLIYGDMHDQITAFYYHFYDFFKGDTSLFINFTTSGGVNFWGVMAYYILSPFSFLLLLFERDKIYLAVSIIIALKVLVSCITCAWALKTLFKEKLHYLLCVVLALSYGFSGYMFYMYQITPWMDAVYLFPLVAVGLYKLFKLEKPYLYIITLTLSLIFSFYVSIIGVLFIFILALIYIFTYVDKENRRKVIVSLALSTVISLLLAAFILIPSYLQINSSTRLSIVFKSLFNSKLGPVSDKISFFFPNSILIVTVILLLLDFKKHKKFMKFFVPSIVLLGLPYFVEPINKILHFGSYAFFPCRFGYILFFLLVVASCYYFINMDKRVFNFKFKNIFVVITTILFSVSACLFAYMNYTKIQDGLYKLTISKIPSLILILAIISFIFMLAILFIIYIKKKDDKLFYPLLLLVVTIQACVWVSCNMGLTNYYRHLDSQYETMNIIESTYKEGDIYRIKRSSSGLIMNTGMVTRYSNLDHFTSLVDNNNLKFLKTMGYTSYWTKTYSKNGSLFMDVVLANKYLLTKENLNDNKDYSLIVSDSGFKLYEYNKDISYGYFVNNISVFDKENDFNIENDIYEAITGDDSDIFTIYNDFKLNNISVTNTDGYYNYQIIDSNYANYIEKDFKIKNKKDIYLDLFYSLDNNIETKIYKCINIYVNDKLYESDYPYSTINGSLYLGTYDNEDVNIKIVFNNGVKLKKLELVTMDHKKLDNLISNYKVDSSIEFTRNKIKINVNSDSRKLYFIPVTYIDGYNVTVNGEDADIIKVFDNYLGVYVNEGENSIVYTFIPKGLKISSVISLVALILTILMFKCKLYDKIVNNKLLGNILYYIYLGLYIVLLSGIYLIPFVCFILSFFIYI